MQAPHEAPRRSSPFALLRHGLLAAAALLMVPAFAATHAHAHAHKPAASAGKTVKKSAKSSTAAHGKAKKATAGRKAAKSNVAQGPGPLADFGKVTASPEAVRVANWASYTRNHQKHSFIVIDKKAARLYLFTPDGKLKGDTQVLLGKAVGDTMAPGIGNLPLSKIPDDQKTTPAGRFLVERGLNNHGDDVFWIDYKAALSMHRMHSVSASERRAERMASAEVDDNRISNGCVNVPARFYDAVLKPAVMKKGAVVYVLPETTTPERVFGSLDVPAKQVQTAQGPGSRPRS